MVGPNGLMSSVFSKMNKMSPNKSALSENKYKVLNRKQSYLYN